MSPFLPSLSPDITEGLPIPLGGTQTSHQVAPSGWDVSFDGLGFLLRPSAATPYQRGTEAMNKQQIDTSDEAGEQTLGSWWVRSQDSWEMGAGIRWYEPKAEVETKYRFARSLGVDPWRPGELRLLHRADLQPVVAGSQGWVCTLDTGAQHGYVEVRGETARWFSENGSTIFATTGATGTNFTQPVARGSVAWAGSSTGLWKFDTVAGTVTKIVTHGTGTSRVWSAKGRFIASVDNLLYEIPFSGAGAIGTAGKVIYTHSDPAWRWTDVVETGAAILASGHTSGDSAVFRFAIVNDPVSGDPILSSASQVGRMPPGEVVTCMGVYLGTNLVLGTTYGVRVGQASSTGDISYGPLTIETTSPVLDVTFRDRFAYVALTGDLYGGLSGAARIDLSAEVGSSGRFAWAHDVSTPPGVANSVALLGGRVVVCVGSSHYLESATQYVASGFLDSGRMRFRTVEGKAFRLAKMVSNVDAGRVLLAAIDSSNAVHSVVNFDTNYVSDSDVAIVIPNRAVNQFLSFRFTLESSTDGLSTPTVGGLVIKAVPASGRVRLFQYPLSVFDSESDRFGSVLTGAGAYQRLKALEALEETGAPVQVTDHRTEERYTGQVESVNFSSTSPPDRHASGFGGVAVVQVRRI